MERELKVNRVYRHFKGGEYVVLGVSKPVLGINLNSVTSRLDTTHTETLDGVRIYKIGNIMMHWGNSEPRNCELIIYMALYGDYQTYARPYDMFMSKVEPGRELGCNKEYRLELVED